MSRRFQCDSCPNTYDGTVDQLVARRWGYWQGQSGSGSSLEHIICRECRTTERKRPLKLDKTYEDEPLF